MSIGGSHRVIIVAIDNSDYSEFAFDFYLENIYRVGDDIILIHVPEFSNVINAPALLTDPNIVADLVREEDSRTRALVEKYSYKMRDAHVSGCVKKVAGKTGEAILEATRAEGASMVIVGTRGMGKIRRTLLGSVSDFIVHHSTVPVLVCRQK